MDGKNEKKILDELRKRVIARDRQLDERKDQLNVINSSKEALTELTDLSRSEVNKIEKEIREELLKKAEKTKKRIKWAVIASAIIGMIAFFWPAKEPNYHFIENFDNNEKAWQIINEFQLKSSFKNGAYTVTANQEGKCFLDFISVKLPNSYSVELKSKWKSGKFAEYNLVLMEGNNNYLAFSLRADGYTQESFMLENKQVAKNVWQKENFSGKDTVIQRVDVVDNTYKYYIDGKLILKGNLKKLKTEHIAIEVCDRQTVSFLNLKIKNLSTGEIVLSESFEKPSKTWKEKDKYRIKAKIEKGKYIVSCNNKGQCYSLTTKPELKLPIAEKSKYTVKTKMKWLNGDDSDFGIVLLEDYSRYIAFNVKSSGNAQVILSTADKEDAVSEYIDFGIVSDGKTTLEIKIEVDDDNYNFFVNEKLLKSGNFSNTKVNFMALRVCGQESVAFEDVEIIEN